jgi:signal transduction histidine kinase/ActR/RegA family two-component response regulator
MDDSIQPFFRGLRFRLIAPMVLIVVLLGAGLYIFVLSAFSDFSNRQIKDTLADLTRQVYDICDRNFTALMNEGTVEDPRAVRIRKAQTVGAIEDFIQRHHAEGLLWDTASGSLLIDTAPPVVITRIPKDPASWGEATFQSIDGSDYFLRHETFRPWQWHFILIRDTGSYAPLMQRVRRAYALTIALLVLVVAALLMALNRSVRQPLQQIIAALQRGRAPDYQGTTEFAFLSDNIREMMGSLEENADWLSRLYHMALSNRGDAFFDRVAETVATGFGGNAIINRIDPASKRVQTVALFRNGQRHEALAYDLSGTPCERIVHTRLPVICETGAGSLFPEAANLQAARAEAYIGYPIFNRDANVIGVLQAFGPARQYTLWDQNLFKTICQMIAGEYALVDREAAESRLREHVFRTQKLESLGVLAGGIAHDFNNLLTAMMGNISLAKLDGDAGPLTTGRLEAAEKAAFRAQELTRQLLTFSKGGAPVKSPVNRLDELIRETADFSLRGSSVGCVFAFAPNLWTVEIDAGQFSQVIQNLVVNAQEAMPEGGRIRIEAENRTIDRHEAPPLDPGRYVQVRVADPGVGIAPGLLEKIFDPYFTTKKRGSGLGLAVCFSIIKQHDGHMAVTSCPGHGTTFDIYIPTTDKQAKSAPANDAHHHRGQGRVLVMDDEEVVREWLGEALRQMGYDPAFAETGEEAIAAHAAALEAKQPFAVLIMDLTIAGGMGGRQALARIRERDPGVKAVVASGYSNDPVMADHRRYGFRGVAVKPYRVEALASALKRLRDPATV